MPRFIFGRLFRSVVTLVLFQIVLFGLIQALNQALPENIEALELAVFSMSGLDDLDAQTSEESAPIWEQFRVWMTAFYRWDLGVSNADRSTPVLEILMSKLPRTLLLLIPGTLIGFLLGMGIGKRVAWRRSSWVEFSATLGGSAFYTAFPPWLAFVMINVFALSLTWFPPEKLITPKMWILQNDFTLNDIITNILATIGAVYLGYLILVQLTRRFARKRPVVIKLSIALVLSLLAFMYWNSTGRWELVLDILKHLALPTITLILLTFGETMLIMKTTMTESIGAEHVFTAQAKGLPNAQVRDRHAARVALLPVLTNFIVHLPLVIVGSFVVEHFFFWDGMGQELIRAAVDNDLPVLMGVLSIVGIGILLIHTLLDILLAWLDPRLRSGSKSQLSVIKGRD